MRRWTATARQAIAAALIALSMMSNLGTGRIAVAAEGDLEVSADGTSWTAEFPTTLFPDGLLLAPGGDASAVAFARNAAETPGVLTIAAAGTNDWPGNDDVTIEVVVSTEDLPSAADSRTLAALAESPEFAIEATLEPGIEARIDIRVSIDATASNNLQDLPLDLDLEVRLAGDSATVPVTPGPRGGPPSSSPPATDDDADGGGRLATTGARVATTVTIAAVVLAAGAVVQHLAKTRRHHRSPSEY